jgi:thiol-disulfide isomerase/thioredoxin
MKLSSTILFYLGLLSSASAAPSQTSPILGPVEVSKEFPSFGSYDLNGTYVSLDSLLSQNKIIVVSYFTTWCAPCREGLPIIEEIVQNDPNVIGVYIDLGEKSDTVKRMATELNLNSTIVIDKFQSVGKRHGVVIEGQEIILPRSFVLAADGTVKTIFMIEGDDFRAELLASIESTKTQTGTGEKKVVETKDK